MSSDAENVKAKKPQQKEGVHTFTFPSHHSHMVNLAQMCKMNNEFTDCEILCDGDQSLDSSVKAHRLVLSSVSSFLKQVFADFPSSLPNATILVPGVKKRVVEALLDFLYTGQMKVIRRDVVDLKLLIDALKISPDLICVNVASGQDSDAAEQCQVAVKRKPEPHPRKDGGGGDDDDDDDDDDGPPDVKSAKSADSSSPAGCGSTAPAASASD